MEQTHKNEIAAAIIGSIQMLLTGNPDHIAQAEERLMGLQSSPTWKENLMVYTELASNEDAQVSLISYIQIKYILKQNAKYLDNDELKGIIKHLFVQKAKIVGPVIPTYSDLIGIALFQLFVGGQEAYVLDAAKELIQGISPILVEAFNKGFTNNDLEVHLLVLLSLGECLLSEKSYMNETQKASMKIFYQTLKPEIQKTTTGYLEFLKLIVDGIEKLNEYNRNKVQENNTLYFGLLKIFVRECNETKELYNCFTDFPTMVLNCVSAFFDNQDVFEFIIDILGSYFVLMNSSLDYMKNSFDFLAKNLTFMLTLTGVPKVVKSLSEVILSKVEQRRHPDYCSEFHFKDFVYTIPGHGRLPVH